MSDRTEDRLTWLVWALLFLVVALATGFARAVPFRPEKLIDPTGTYAGKCGERACYEVTIGLYKGKMLAQWNSVNGGQVHYVGMLEDQKDGTWRETYMEHEGLHRCGPWTWRVVGENPLAFEDAQGSWTLTVAKPEF